MLQDPSSKSDLNQYSVEKDQAIPLLESDLNFLAAVAIPGIFQYLYPDIFVAIWNWIRETVNKIRFFSKLAIGLPRGFGKTTFIKLVLLYCILFTRKCFILIVSANATLAEAILLDLAEMLDEENIKKIFGNWRLGLQIDRQDLKIFGFRGRNIIIRAAGAGVGIRGINYKHYRPDIILFEDIQTREQADSEIESRALEQWLLGTAMKTKSPFGCTYLFIANMYPTQWSLLKKLKHNPEWVSFVVGGILANGESLWEELHPVAQLLEEMRHDEAAGHPEIFRAEVLNDETASRNYLIDISLIPQNPYEDGSLRQGACVIIDPATDKPNADFVALGTIEFYEGRPVLRKVIEDKLSPMATIEKAVEMAIEAQTRLIFIEGNAYQSTLGYWFTYITIQRQLFGFQVEEIYSGGKSKASRIVSMFQELLPQKGNPPDMFIHTDARPAVFTQILAYDPLAQKNRDNILDLLCYGKRLLSEFSHLILSDNAMWQQDSAALGVSPAEVTSAF